MNKPKHFIFVLFFLVLSGKQISAQGLTNVWITGYFVWDPLPWGNTVTNFISGSPISSFQNMNLSFMRTNASIADTAGNLLFYTNGFNVCNALGNIMPNGAGLDSCQAYDTWYQDGAPSPQAALIIPYPAHPDSFYLFHQAIEDIQWPNLSTYAPLELYYSIIDMYADSGRGDLIERQVTFLQDTIQNGRLTACKHANGRDWWLVTRECYSDAFYIFLITPDGISAPIKQHIGSILLPPDLGQVCFSEQGDKYALIDHLNGLRLFDFDRCSGVFSNPIYIPLDSVAIKGLAFSPSGQFLYVANNVYVYQYDMWSANIGLSQLTVASWDSTYSPQWPSATTFYSSQLGPDGKIYISCGNGTDVMHVINNPDSLGISCNVCQHCISLPTYNSFGCIPNYPNYFLGAENGSICDSLTVDLTELSHDFKLNIFPNPIVKSFSIDYLLPQNSPGKLEIFDLLGNKIFEYYLPAWSTSQSLTLPAILEGVYQCRVTSGYMNCTKKFFYTHR